MSARSAPRTRVINVTKEGKAEVFIGRPSKWGNPFKIGPDGTREQVVEQYHEWILTQPELLTELPALKGKSLGCYCAPARCHGHVLADLVERVYPCMTQLYHDEPVAWRLGLVSEAHPHQATRAEGWWFLIANEQGTHLAAGHGWPTREAAQREARALMLGGWEALVDDG